MNRKQVICSIVSKYHYVFRPGAGPGYHKLELAQRERDRHESAASQSSCGWPLVHRPRGLWRVHYPYPEGWARRDRLDVVAALMSLSGALRGISDNFITPRSLHGVHSDPHYGLIQFAPVRRPKTEQQAIEILRARAHALSVSAVRDNRIRGFVPGSYSTLALASMGPSAREYVRGDKYLMADAGIDALGMLRPLLVWRCAAMEEFSRKRRHYAWEDHSRTLSDEMGAWAICAFRLVSQGELGIGTQRLRVLRAMRYGFTAMAIHHVWFHIDPNLPSWPHSMGMKVKRDMDALHTLYMDHYLRGRARYIQSVCPVGGHTGDFESLALDIQILGRQARSKAFVWPRRLRVGHLRRSGTLYPSTHMLRTWVEVTCAWAHLVWKVANMPRGRRDCRLPAATLGRLVYSQIRKARLAILENKIP